MPAAAPRSNTTKKENQLRQKQRQLEHAIRCGLSPNQLAKARLHWLSEAHIQRSGKFHPATRDYGQIDAIEKMTRLWSEKSVEEILCKHRKT